MTTPADLLLAWRRELPILQNTTYLISHSLGAKPRRAAGALQEFADTWASGCLRPGRRLVGNPMSSIISAGRVKCFAVRRIKMLGYANPGVTADASQGTIRKAMVRQSTWRASYQARDAITAVGLLYGP